MSATGFARILKQVQGLSVDEIVRLKEAVATREDQVADAALLRERERLVHHCAHCGHESIVRYGKSAGRQRYRCKSCQRTFNALTGTSLAHLHWPTKHLENARCLAARCSVRESAARMDVAVSTAFRWRHRFLSRLEPLNPKLLVGVVEADETYFRESFKGQRDGLPRPAKKRGRRALRPGLSREQIPVLVARERATGATFTQRLATAQAKDIGPALIPRLSSDVVLITDGAKAYKKAVKQKKITLKRVPRDPKHRTRGMLHLNNVNAYDQRLKGWMTGFIGVATKYLPNYLAWHRWHDANTKGRTGPRLMSSALQFGSPAPAAPPAYQQ